MYINIANLDEILKKKNNWHLKSYIVCYNFFSPPF